MKKTIMSITICLMMFACLMIPVSAETEYVPIQPASEYTRDAITRLSITNQTATAVGQVTGYSGKVTKMTVTVYLQVKSGTSWSNVSGASWSNTVSKNNCTVSGKKAVTKGKTYRTKLVYTTWSGSKSESNTIYSAAKIA